MGRLRVAFGPNRQTLPCPSQHSHTSHHLRTNLHTNHSFGSNGFAFQCLSIAGSNTILSNLNHSNALNPTNFIQIRHKTYKFDKYSIDNQPEPKEENFKNYTHKIQYDTSQPSVDAFFSIK